MNRYLPLIKVDQIAQERMLKLLKALRSPAKKEDPKYLKFEKAAVPFLIFKAKVFKLAHLSEESFKALPLKKMNRCYWEELDQVIDWVRCTVFELIRARITGALDCKDDHVIAAMHLRQLIEICVWAAYYQYMQTTAFNIISRMQRHGELKHGTYTSKPLEDVIRAAVAPDPNRIGRIAKVTGNIEVSDPNNGINWISEISASFVKQVSAIKHVARTADEADKLGMVKTVELLEDSYHFCCGLVHPTALLLQSITEDGAGQLDGIVPDFLMDTVSASVHLVQHLYFDQRFEVVRFWPFFEPLYSDQVKSFTDLQLPSLAEMKKTYAPITFALKDGGKIIIYDKNQKRS